MKEFLVEHVGPFVLAMMVLGTIVGTARFFLGVQ